MIKTNKTKTQKRGWAGFLEYAITTGGVHNGPSTIADLRGVYDKHKGSNWDTIITLFKAAGQANFLDEYIKTIEN